MKSNNVTPLLCGLIAMLLVLIIVLTMSYTQSTKNRVVEVKNQYSYTEYLTGNQIQRAKLLQFFCKERKVCKRAEALDAIGKLSMEFGE